MSSANAKTIEQEIRRQVGQKRHVVDGKINQVKGKAQEKIGELTNNKRLRRAGKRQQLRGKIQEKGGRMASSKLWLMLGTAVALIAAFIFLRSNSNNEAPA